MVLIHITGLLYKQDSNISQDPVIKGKWWLHFHGPESLL